MKKNLYKGTFNWHGEVHILYRWAQNPDSAMRLFLLTLVKVTGYNKHHLKMYFTGKDNHKVEFINLNKNEEEVKDEHI